MDQEKEADDEKRKKKIADKKERVDYLRHVNDQLAAVDNSTKEIRERKFKQ